MSRIPPEIVRQVREKTNIVELIGGRIKLKKSGSDFLGLCPFHTEHTPSFRVSKRKNVYYCYGCKEGGDVIDWVVTQEDVAFKDAVLMLARDLGIDVPAGPTAWEWKPREMPKIEAKPPMLIWPERSIERFAGKMPKYMLDRGITISTAMAYGIGFDRADKRATFPVRKANGDLVGVSGRTTADSKIKYMHYRLDVDETRAVARIPKELYASCDEDELDQRFVRWAKSRVLYGGHVAVSQSLAPSGGWRDENLYLVEGHIDVHSYYQRRLRAVATMGSSVSSEQGDLLVEMTPVRGRLVCVPDPDMKAKFSKGSTKSLFDLYVEGLKSVVYDRVQIWHQALPPIRVKDGQDVKTMSDDELDKCERLDPASLNDDEFEDSYAKIVRIK